MCVSTLFAILAARAAKLKLHVQIPRVPRVELEDARGERDQCKTLS